MRAKTIIFILWIILLSVSALAETYIYLDTDAAGNTKLSVIEETLYYKSSFFRGFSPESGGFSVVFLDSDNNIILEGEAYPSENNLYPFDTRIASFEVSSIDNLLYQRQISFCNLNSVCEPCTGSGCILIENYHTCTDCPSGGEDYFCDLIDDGVCDPDCDNKDADCLGCTDCWYRDTTMPSISCAADKVGVACTPGQLCTGKYVYADDTGSLCCTAGVCMDKDVVVTSDGQDDTPRIPDEPASSGQKPPENLEKSPFLWIIPLIAIIIIVVLGYFLLIKPKASK